MLFLFAFSILCFPFSTLDCGGISRPKEHDDLIRIHNLSLLRRLCPHCQTQVLPDSPLRVSEWMRLVALEIAQFEWGLLQLARGPSTEAGSADLRSPGASWRCDPTTSRQRALSCSVGAWVKASGLWENPSMTSRDVVDTRHDNFSSIGVRDQLLMLTGKLHVQWGGHRCCARASTSVRFKGPAAARSRTPRKHNPGGGSGSRKTPTRITPARTRAACSRSTSSRRTHRRGAAYPVKARRAIIRERTRIGRMRARPAVCDPYFDASPARPPASVREVETLACGGGETVFSHTS
ncbi:hypothetical protein B0H13DRAFT_1911589 [Mycena leptocephala]|nr:hypothetical protein B0H13DRAFT_1911589 [Mycena leptocephala]